MSESIQVQVADSHLYPGCAVNIAHLPESARAAEAIVEFADGAGAHAAPSGSLMPVTHTSKPTDDRQRLHPAA